jgi:AcrR family transcriptional regulator
MTETDPRVKRTRQLLLQAFTDVLVEKKNIHSITIGDITERATVNRATFYAHFEDKYALLDSWMRELFQQELARRLPAPPSLSVSVLHELILAVFDFLAMVQSYRKRVNKQFDSVFETALQQELQKVLLTLLEQTSSCSRQGRETLEITASIASWAIFGPAAQWSREAGTCSAEEMTIHVLPVVIAGLSRIAGPIA